MRAFQSFNAKIGDTCDDVDPLSLKPSYARRFLGQSRLQLQRFLLATGTDRRTPIRVTENGVIWDGHHGVRAAAEAGRPVSVLVVPGADQNPPGTNQTVLDLPVR